MCLNDLPSFYTMKTGSQNRSISFQHLTVSNNISVAPEAVRAVGKTGFSGKIPKSRLRLFSASSTTLENELERTSFRVCNLMSRTKVDNARQRKKVRLPFAVRDSSNR